VSTTTELEANLQPQACSPAQDNSEESEQEGKAQGDTALQFVGSSSPVGEQNPGEQQHSTDPTRVSIAMSESTWVGKFPGEQFHENGEHRHKQQFLTHTVVENPGEQTMGEQSVIEMGRFNGANCNWSAQLDNFPLSGGEHKSEHPAQVVLPAAHQKSISLPGDQTLDEQSAQWLKSILPEALNGNGWWEVRVKSKGFSLMFRWRDPDLQVLTLQCVTRDEMEKLGQTDSEDHAKDIIREQIVETLHKFACNLAKRQKALVAAEKLGIHIDIDVKPA
jgi:hypothetical protein